MVLNMIKYVWCVACGGVAHENLHLTHSNKYLESQLKPPPNASRAATTLSICSSFFPCRGFTPNFASQSDSSIPLVTYPPVPDQRKDLIGHIMAQEMILFLMLISDDVSPLLMMHFF